MPMGKFLQPRFLAHTSNANSGLLVHSVYQDYYQVNQLKTMSSSTISWIGSVQVFFLYAGGLIGGPLFDQLGAVVSSKKIFPFAKEFCIAENVKELDRAWGLTIDVYCRSYFRLPHSSSSRL